MGLALVIIHFHRIFHDISNQLLGYLHDFGHLHIDGPKTPTPDPSFMVNFAEAGVVLVAIMLTIVGSMALMAGFNYGYQILGDHFGA